MNCYLVYTAFLDISNKNQPMKTVLFSGRTPQLLCTVFFLVILCGKGFSQQEFHSCEFDNPNFESGLSYLFSSSSSEQEVVVNFPLSLKDVLVFQDSDKIKVNIFAKDGFVEIQSYGPAIRFTIPKGKQKGLELIALKCVVRSNAVSSEALNPKTRK